MAEERKLKCGDTREDGMVFYQYRKDCRGGEHWITPAKLEEYRLRRYAHTNRKYAEDEEYRLRCNERNREYGADYSRRPEVKDRINARARERRAADPLYALKGALRSRVSPALRRIGKSKDGGTEEILGCSFEDFKAHIESLFIDGMSWENRSEWHIDHIIPLASATTEEELYRLCHYTNQRPLWAKDNLIKGAKLCH